MKLFLIAFITLVLVACGASDQEQLLGKWKFTRVEQGGKLLLSEDPKEEKAIISRMVNENRDRFSTLKMNESQIRQNLKEDMQLLLAVTFDFKNDSLLVIENNNPENQGTQNWDYKLNKEKKELTIKEPMQTNVYKYEFKEDRLILRSGKDRIDFVRQTK